MASEDKPKFRRLDSMATHKSAMDEYLEKGVTTMDENIKEVNLEKVMKDLVEHPEMLTDPEAMQAFQKKMSDQCAESMKGKMVNEVAGLWDEYDKDKNGSLSKEECTKLLGDAVIWYSKNLDAVLDKTLDVMKDQAVAPAMMVAKVQIKNLMKAQFPDCSDEELEKKCEEIMPKEEDVRAQMEMMFAMAMPKIKTAVSSCYEDMSNNKDDLASKMIEEMDVNHDGTVSKEEFKEHFIAAMSHIVDLGQMLKKMGMV